MLLHSCLIFLASCSLAVAMQLVNTSQNDMAGQVAIEGQRMEMSCLVDQPWRWCYWVNLQDNQTRYQTAQGRSESASPHPRISFVREEFRCGLRIDNITRKEAGTWKCHLADTDLEDTNKAEGYTQVKVASPAQMVFTSSLDNNEDEKTVLGEQLDLQCSLDDVDVFPLPEISILEGGGRLLTNQSNITKLEYTHSVKMDDDAKTFLCELVQILDGEVFHREVSHTDNIRLVFPPKMIPGERNHSDPYIFENDTLEIPILFSARPVPNVDDIMMTIIDKDGQEKETLTAGNACEHFNVSTIQPIPGKQTDHDQYLISVQVKNLTHNATIIVKMSNPYGELSKMVNIVYIPPPPPPPSPNKTVLVGQAGFPLYLIILMIIFVLLFVFLLCCCCCCCCWRRRRREKIQEKTTTDNIQVDLDAISDKKIHSMEKEMSDMSGGKVAPSLYRSGSGGEDEAAEEHLLLKGMKEEEKEQEEQGTGRDYSDGPSKGVQLYKRRQESVERDALNESENGNGLPSPSLPDVVDDVSLRNSQAVGDKLVRMSGPTNFPVVSPYPQGYQPTSLSPGRRTSTMHFMGERSIRNDQV